MKGEKLEPIWIAFGVGIFGVLAAAIANGSAPAWWLLGLLVVFPMAITMVLRGRATRRPPPLDSRPFARPDPAPSRSRSRDVREEPSQPGALAHRIDPSGERLTSDPSIRSVLDALSQHEVEWLCSNNFVAPWLDQHVRPIVDLAPLVEEALNRPVPRDIGPALVALSEALDSAIDFYFARTYPDPALVGHEWRFFSWDAEGIADSNQIRDGLAVRLQGLVADVLDAHSAFVIAIRGYRRNDIRQANRKRK